MKVLHLVGSQQSEYYYGVSVLYAPGFLKTFTELTNIILLARLDGTWSLPSTLAKEDVEAAERLTLPQALQRLQEEEIYKPDIMQPHMFCYKGMVTFRYIADMLDIPIVGCSGSTMALTTDKWQSRAVVSSMGVPVPKAQLLRAGEHVELTLEPPFILKPCREDNSMGVTLVRQSSEIEQALKTAFTFDDMILCEEFIPLGREIRVGVIESADDPNKLELLPTLEYFLHANKEPIRTSADKLTNVSTDENKDDNTALDFAQTNRKIPADVDDTLRQKLYDLATKSHIALGCQHYSLYDVRVSPAGEPYFIEACTYCSFSPRSVIVTMGRGGDKYDDKELFYRIAKRAIATHKAEKEARAKSTQKLGMRSNRNEASSPTTVVVSQ